MRNVKTLREMMGLNQTKFAERYGIPRQTLLAWESGRRAPPEYVVDMLERLVKADALNRRALSLLPSKDRGRNKKVLPTSGDYIQTRDWLTDIVNELGNVVLALDNALMCDGSYLGMNNEYIVYCYGPKELAAEYRGVVVIGESIPESDVVETPDGVRCTKFNRTLIDALANDDLLDMQGITEALNHYYCEHNCTFDGLVIPPHLQEKFEQYSIWAMEYYTY